MYNEMGQIKDDSTVCVIIPTYNRGNLISKSVKSVLNQTYQDFELIVIDDASIDNTREIVNSFADKRIRYIKLEKNKGAANARNVGLKVARGKYIAFQDSDDEWLPEKLEKQMKAFQILPANVGVVYTDMYRISNGNTKIKHWESPHLNSDDDMIHRKLLSSALIKNYGIGIQSTMIRKKCFDKVGFFDERLPMFIDFEMFVKLSYHFRFFHIQEPLVNFYNTSESITSTKGGNRHIIANNLILQKHFCYIKKDKKLLTKYCSWLSERMICSKDTFNQGRKYLLMQFSVDFFNIKLFLKTLTSFFGIKFYLKMSNIGHRLLEKNLDR